MKGANGNITYFITMKYLCNKKISVLAAMMTMLMVCFTFAACGGSDDDDPGNVLPEGTEQSGEFIVEDKYKCSDLNYAYWYNNENGNINLTFINFEATSLSNMPKNIHALTVQLPTKELKEGRYTCEFDFDANANSEGGCSLITDNANVVISIIDGVWTVVIYGLDGIYQTFDPDTYSKGEKFTFCYVGSIKYNKRFEEEE